jgi:hypothetical protein
MSIDIGCDGASAIDVCRRGQGRRDRQITGALVAQLAQRREGSNGTPNSSRLMPGFITLPFTAISTDRV